MQFDCPACEGEFELSRRAFGTRTDTRTRCAGCKTWLIVTRSADESLTAVIDPEHEIDAAAVEAARGTHQAASKALAPKPVTPIAQIAPSRRPSAPSAMPMPRAPLLQAPHKTLEEELPPGVADEAHDFFATPRLRPVSASFERLTSGKSLFTLPDPIENTKKRVQMQQVLQDFSVMFRLESKKSNRNQIVGMTLLGLLVVAGLAWGVRAKLAYDRRVDDARDAKIALPAWVLQSAQSEEVVVLGLPGEATGTTSHRGTTLSRQLFMKARSQRPVVAPTPPKVEPAEADDAAATKPEPSKGRRGKAKAKK